MQDLKKCTSHVPYIKKLLEDVLCHEEEANSRKQKIKDPPNRYAMQEMQ